MTRVEVLPRALAASGRAVRQLSRDVEPVPPEELGDAGLSAALDDYARAWSGSDLVDAAEECARALEAAAQEYAHVESLLLPRVLR